MIDVDCIESDRPKIFEHIIARFGQEKCARVPSYGTLQDLTTIDDIGRALANRWKRTHNEFEENPYSLTAIADLKKQYSEDKDAAIAERSDIFYYFDGICGTKKSQSVHPAGMVISPVELTGEYGTFCKDGEQCLLIDMDEIHDIGLVKYDLLVLKTINVIRDACNYADIKYPYMHEIDWDDVHVWDEMLTSEVGIFQMEGNYAYSCLKKFRPQSIFDLSLVTASIRPSGASYRDALLARKINKNPSSTIDELLKDNLGYLVYQEDTIKFLQEVCGLSGSDADNIRRAIGRKQRDRLDAAMPDILKGYCAKSQQPKEIAEEEAKQFLQIIEDSSNYQFGYNHSIAYCLISYLCAYYRHYYPIEFITSFLNNAANDADIINGTNLAKKRGYRIISPKWGISRSNFYFNKEKKTIAKGLNSVKNIGETLGDELYEVSQRREYISFVDLLIDMKLYSSLKTNQLDILIKMDFFSSFGNQPELLRILNMFNMFKGGKAKKLSAGVVENSQFYDVIARYSTNKKKDGTLAKQYTLIDTFSIMHECEDIILEAGIEDITVMKKARNFFEVAGYFGLITENEVDRPKLFIKDITPLKRKRDGKLFGYSVDTVSIGSGKESQMTIMKNRFTREKLSPGDVILCLDWKRDGQYFKLVNYIIIDKNED